ncbi:hypothetical protein G7051_15115 [Dysgonomonas sp. HDW5B]|uniref:hypothetical protein n=1 Tax=Dysgonomonas sp. HDW5B TaxID=2714927 RepID=UPI00140BCE7B|nr:hypothetical protein [Dysgonomonas sp. HDW5B]QIK55605.1 hypothetical protein G7051_15115 [Dysgonomonas sp. HDW5B]
MELQIKKKKLNKKEIIILVIMMFWGFVLLVMIFFKTTYESKERMARYPSLDNQITIEGNIIRIEVELGYNKGARYVDLSNGSRFRTVYPTFNYTYQPYEFDTFLQLGDSISKRAENDTILIYRNNKKYYFVLNKEINKNEKK